MVKAIQTRFKGITDTQVARIIARAEGMPAMTIPWDYALDVGENHVRAAIAYTRALHWGEALVSGLLPDGSYAHCYK